jgi:putative Mn2+ efflux pump MntP
MLALLLVAASVGLSNFAAAVSLGVGGVDGRTRLRVGLVYGVFESGMPVVGLLIGDHVAAQLGQTGHWVGGALLIGVGLYAIVGSVRARRAARKALAEAVNPTKDDAGAGASEGTPSHGSPSDGSPSDGSPSHGSPSHGSPSHGSPSDGTARNGAPSYGAPSYGATSYGAPSYGATSYGAPGHAAAGNGGLLRLLLSALALSLDNLVVGFALGTYQVAILVGAVIIGAVSVLLSLAGLELGARLGGWAGERSDQLGGVILISVGVAVAAGALS